MMQIHCESVTDNTKEHNHLYCTLISHPTNKEQWRTTNWNVI